MIERELLKVIKKKRQQGEFIYPLYGSHSIAEIVPTILALFGASPTRAGFPFINHKVGEYRKVILLFVDGLGYDHFLRYRTQFSFLERLATAGDVYPVTSVFPSTTAAAVTTIHTGLTPQEHGLPEWTVYFEELDEVIETLPFRPVKTEGTDSMLRRGGTPEMLFKGRTVYQKLKSKGVKSFVFIRKDLVHSVYSRTVQKGSKVISFDGCLGLAEKLRSALRRSKGRAYFFVYWGDIDSAEHHYGPNSTQHKKALATFFDTLEKEFVKKLKTGSFRDTLLLLSSDHGQVNVDPKKTVYLNTYPRLIEHFSRSKRGNVIPPTGSPRDVFLNIQSSHVGKTITFLRRILKDKARVLTISEALRKGLFGVNNPAKRFKRRIGNLLILPRKHFVIWYEHVPGKLFEHLGMHGGATEKEMIVPFAAARLSEL